MLLSRSAAAKLAPRAALRARTFCAAEPMVIRSDSLNNWTTLTLNQPKKRNALSSDLMGSLQTQLDQIDADPSIRLVVIEANGPVFCSGHDLKEVKALQVSALFEQCGVLMRSIAEFRCPIIAKVNGVATAAGCQLVASCDLAIATAPSRFATPGVNIGLFFSTPAVALSRCVGRKAAMEMLLTGDMISSEHAVSIGLINRAVPEEELEETVAGLATQIASKAASAINIGKAAFNKQLPLELEDAYAQMGAVMTSNTLNADANEGIGAFLEKRSPEWKMQ